MKGFRFRLQSVLDYRRTLADRAQLELAILQEQRRQEEVALEGLRASERTTLRAQQNAQQDRLDLPKLTQFLDHLYVLSGRIAEQVAVVEQRRREAEELQQALIGMVREVKALEKLRERQQEEFKQAALRREQEETSEVAALQFRRLQTSAARGTR